MKVAGALPLEKRTPSNDGNTYWLTRIVFLRYALPHRGFSGPGGFAERGDLPLSLRGRLLCFIYFMAFLSAYYQVLLPMLVYVGVHTYATHVPHTRRPRP
jgi:hypothetical protein